MFLKFFYRSFFSLSLLVGFFISEAQAVNSHPISVIFRDGNGAGITTSLDLRISLWDTYDVREEDFDLNGVINTAARHYGQYQTTLTIHPDENGYFTPSTYGFYSFRTSNLPSFPDTSPFNGFLQVEYKTANAPDTSYLIYDFVDDPPFQHVTRLLLDENSTYYVNEAGPKTSWNTFTLDANNNAPTEIKLQFGETLAKSLSYHMTNTRFELNDHLFVSGDLTLSGSSRQLLIKGTSGEDYSSVIRFAGEVDDNWRGGYIQYDASGIGRLIIGIHDADDKNTSSDVESIIIDRPNGNVGIGITAPQSALHIPDGKYLQVEDNNAGAPPAADCDANAERGRISLDTTNNRLYICNGATRGWDYMNLID